MDVTRWYPYLSLFLCIVLIIHQLGCRYCTYQGQVGCVFRHDAYGCSSADEAEPVGSNAVRPGVCAAVPQAALCL